MSSLSSQAISLPQTPISDSFTATTRSCWEQGIARFNDSRLSRGIQKVYGDNVGLLLIAVSQLFATFMNITVKFLNQIDDPVPTLELILVRMFFTYCCSLTYMLVSKIPHPVLGPPEVRYLLMVRAFTGFFGLFGLYFSLKYLSVSDSVVLTFLAPTTTAIAGSLFLHEPIAKREVIAGLLSLVGVILIARPAALFGKHLEGTVLPVEGNSDVLVSRTIMLMPTPAQRLLAVGAAMFGVLGMTGAFVSLRAIGKRAHPLHSMTIFSGYAVIASTIGMIVFRVKPVIPVHLSWAALLFLIGISGYMSQILLTMGLQRETASRGTLALYCQIVYATALERIIFNVTPSYLSVLGTLIIMGNAIYIVMNKETKPSAYEPIPQNIDNLELGSQASTDGSTEPQSPLVEASSKLSETTNAV